MELKQASAHSLTLFLFSFSYRMMAKSEMNEAINGSNRTHPFLHTYTHARTHKAKVKIFHVTAAKYVIIKWTRIKLSKKTASKEIERSIEEKNSTKNKASHNENEN